MENKIFPCWLFGSVYLCVCIFIVTNCLHEKNMPIWGISEIEYSEYYCFFFFWGGVFEPNYHFLIWLTVWDKKMVHTQFNWCWYHVPTFAPYKVEGMFFPLILAHGSTAQSAKTAAIVLQSLTPNAQSVFRVLAEYQLSHPDEEGKKLSVLLRNFVVNFSFYIFSLLFSFFFRDAN